MEYDIKKMKYDLAMMYAKSKLDHALATNTVPEGCDPESNAALEYLANEFYAAVTEFQDYDDSIFPSKHDF